MKCGPVSGCLSLASLCATASAVLLSPRGKAADVSFFAVVKLQKFNQDTAGLPTPGAGNPFRINAIANPTATGSIVSGTVKPPVGTVQSLAFDPLNQWFIFQAKFPTATQLDAVAPQGSYTLTLSTLHDGQRTLPMNLPAAAYPNGPHVNNFAIAQTINPSAPFTLTWDPFVGGTANDGILFLVGDATTGALLLRSPLPGQPGALSGTATSISIPAGTLPPNQDSLCELTFFKTASRDDASYPGAIGYAGFASFTDFGIHTTAKTVALSLSFRHFAQGGTFSGGNTSATLAAPVSVNGYRAELQVTSVQTFGSPTQVLFTGPPGSGLTNTVSDPATFSSTGTNAFYFSPKINHPTLAPAGVWLASYEGASETFTEPDPEVALRLVVPTPSATVANGVLTSMAWNYFHPDGTAWTGIPGFIHQIRVQGLDATGAMVLDSDWLAPTVLEVAFRIQVNWSSIQTVRFLYSDGSANSFAIGFPKVAGSSQNRLAVLSYEAGTFTFRLAGQPGEAIEIQSSTDLRQWAPFKKVTLTTNVLDLQDNQAGASPTRFFKPVAPPF